jgi:cholesterol transport system auxiliary component
MTPHKSMGRMAITLLAPLVLAGCVNIGGGTPPERLFALNAAVPMAAGAGVSAAPAEALVVVEPEVDRSLAVTRIAVQVDANAVAYLKGGAWIDRPARLFRDLLGETIRASTNRLVVFEDAETPAGAQRLSGRLVAFCYDAPSRSVVVRYDALRRGRDGTLSQRRFEAVEKVASPKAETVADALERASGKVALQVADWVK